MVDSLRTADGVQYTIVLSQHDEPVEVSIDYDDGGGAAIPCGWSRWAPASSGGRRPIRETAGERPRRGEVNLKVPRVPPRGARGAAYPNPLQRPRSSRSAERESLVFRASASSRWRGSP